MPSAAPNGPFFGDFLWTSKESHPAAGRDRRLSFLLSADDESSGENEQGDERE
jgi:hypothetical protein